MKPIMWVDGSAQPMAPWLVKSIECALRSYPDFELVGRYPYDHDNRQLVKFFVDHAQGGGRFAFSLTVAEARDLMPGALASRVAHGIADCAERAWSRWLAL